MEGSGVFHLFLNKMELYCDLLAAQTDWEIKIHYEMAKF